MTISVLQNIILSIFPKNNEVSGAYLWIGLIVATAIFFFFLRKTDKLIIEEKTSISPEEEAPLLEYHDVHEEEAAAIAMALYLYRADLHDKESFTITMQKVSRIYSPWSSKIYTLRQIPFRK